MSQTIRQDVEFGAPPARIFAALTDGGAFSAMTGAPAEIEARAGGAFSCFGGAISGRTIELAPDKRLVQAWRAGDWPEGVFSIVRFDLAPHGAGTRVTLHHAGFPDGREKHLASGWETNYWSAIRRLT